MCDITCFLTKDLDFMLLNDLCVRILQRHYISPRPGSADRTSQSYEAVAQSHQRKISHVKTTRGKEHEAFVSCFGDIHIQTGSESCSFRRATKITVPNVYMYV